MDLKETYKHHNSYYFDIEGFEWMDNMKIYQA